MSAIGFRLRCLLRSRWRQTAAATVVVAVLVAVVLMFAAGARRTLSAPDRYIAADDSPFDVRVFQNSDRGTRSRAAELAALPSTAAIEATTFVFGRLTRATGEDLGPDVTVFSGTIGAVRERLVAGRRADPANAGEFLATRSFVDATHASLGEKFALHTLTQKAADAAGFDGSADGPTVDAVLVGVMDGPPELDDPTPFALFSPALLDDPTIGVAVTLMSVRLAPGTTPDDYQERLTALPDGQAFSVQSASAVSQNVRSAVDAQGQGLELIGLIAAFVSAIVLAQLISRQVRLTAGERSRLSALGMTDPQMFAESAGRATIPIVLGCLFAAPLSTIASGWFPTGFARRLELDAGYHVDAMVLVAGTVVAVVVLLGLTMVVLRMTGPSRRHARPSGPVETVAPHMPTATAATGLRLAFARREGDQGSTRSTVAGLLLIIGSLIGVLAFGSSVDRLVTQADRFGDNYDAQFDNGAGVTPEQLLATLENDADLSALSLYADGQSHVGTTLVTLLGFEQIKGSLAPDALAGRLPASEDEVALGRLTAKDLGVSIGGTVELAADDQPRTLHVTGLVVVPNIGVNDGVGQGAVLTLAGLRRLSSSAGVTPTPVVRVRPGAPADTLQRLGQTTGVAPALINPPPAIVNVSRVRSVPKWLASLLVGLVALTVLHTMVTSLRNRRRDVAVLYALGADRSWVTRVVHWHATLVTLLPAVLALPLGLAAGRFVFTAFANSIGARNEAAMPWLALTIVLVGVVALANLSAAVPGRRARRLTPARLLQTE